MLSFSFILPFFLFGLKVIVITILVSSAQLKSLRFFLTAPQAITCIFLISLSLFRLLLLIIFFFSVVPRSFAYFSFTFTSPSRPFLLL